MPSLQQPNYRPSPLPMLAIVTCSLPGMLAGLTLSEISDAADTLWSGAFWIPPLTGMLIGIALAIVFSLRSKVRFVRIFERELAGHSLRMVAAGAALGLSTTMLALFVCVATSVWSFNSLSALVFLGASSIYGAVAGYGVVIMDIGKNAR